ncbi:MAG: hypothetical protein AAB699_03155 [Patescibacteria group bacterium]
MKEQIKALEIPSLIEKIVKKREITLTELAAAIGVSVPTLCRWQKPSLWQKEKRLRWHHAMGALEKLRAIANEQNDAQERHKGMPVGTQNIISINLGLSKLDGEALEKIRAVKTVLLALESLAEQK